jgi:hypothetical protein
MFRSVNSASKRVLILQRVAFAGSLEHLLARLKGNGNKPPEFGVPFNGT